MKHRFQWMAGPARAEKNAKKRERRALRKKGLKAGPVR